MVVINMPGGAIQNVGEDEILWFRKAFDSEWKGATMLRLVGDRIYSIESVKELSKKLGGADVALANFSAPDAKLKLVVSAKRVRQVEKSDPKIYHEKAKSVLSFSGKVRYTLRRDTK